LRRRQLAIYLAGQGFEVISVDSSPTAIKIATENAQKRGVRCRFIITDLLDDLHEVKETFDFGYDWEFLHHLFPEDREKYVKKCGSPLFRVDIITKTNAVKLKKHLIHKE
jgi:2-polyprenyl-3-methyl-5-hydroxy-6-metoxy-1,4-benzoquinol methylase